MAKRNKNKVRLAAETPVIQETSDTERVEGKTYYVYDYNNESWRLAEDSDFGPEGALVAGVLYGEEVVAPVTPGTEEQQPAQEEPVTPQEDPTPPSEETPSEGEEEEEAPKRIFETHKSCKSLYCVNIMRPRRSRFQKDNA